MICKIILYVTAGVHWSLFLKLPSDKHIFSDRYQQRLSTVNFNLTERNYMQVLHYLAPTTHAIWIAVGISMCTICCCCPVEKKLPN